MKGNKMSNYQKSSYGNAARKVSTPSSASVSSGDSTSTEERPESKTTHYAYTLKRDAEGAVVGKEYLNDVQIYENEGQFGTYLKMRVTGNVPTADYFIQRKKGK
jgi:hypothetical protein